MSLSKIQIDQTAKGRPLAVTLDGHRLPSVRSYQVNNAVDEIPTVTVTFLASAEITVMPGEVQLADIVQNITFNNGSSVKDAVDRIAHSIHPVA